MSISIKTPGDIKRVKQEANRESLISRMALEREQKRAQEKVINQEKALYKKTVSDSYVKIFGENYGDSFDYYSLINSLKFSFKQNNDGTIVPSFSINLNNIEFKSDAERNCQKFNENSYSDFITNENEIDGSYMDVYDFDNSEQYEAYEEGDVLYDDLINLDGSFIPTTKKDRYNNFNKINKIGGYTSPEESNDRAKKIIEKTWKKLIHK